MAGNVVINGRTAVHMGSQGQITAPDVCKTPKKCKPKTYSNVALSANSAKTASTVLVNGNPVCHKDSIFAISSGDEPGSCGGVVSGTIKQKAEFITFSDNVTFEGKPAVRQLDLMVSNNRNTPPVPLQQPGAGIPPPLSPKGANDSDPSDEGDVVEWEVAGDEIHFMKGLLGIYEEDE